MRNVTFFPAKGFPFCNSFLSEHTPTGKAIPISNLSKLLKMKTNLLLLFVALAINLQAQFLAPAVEDNSQNANTNSSIISTVSTCLNGCDRQAIIDDYNTNYLGSSFNNAEMAWTGDAATCDPGTISSSVHQKTLQRINYFRRLCCVSDDIYFDPVKNSKCQEAANMGGLDHCTGPNGAPCDTYLCNTPNAIQASQNSNLTTNNWNYVNPIDMYMKDSGNSNQAVGHRRWILFSRGKEMGNGIVPYKQVLWVLGNYNPTPTYNNFIAYPSPGFFPRSLIYARWSFAIPGANFANASVSVTKNGEAISTTIISSTANFGDPTLVWNTFLSDINFTSDEDVEYEVTVSGISGAPQNTYTYKVFAIKEEMPSVSYETINPYCNDNGVATAHLSAGAENYDWTTTNDSTQTITNLAAGTYHLILTDKKGCEFLDSVVLVTDTITTPHPGDGAPTTLQVISDTGNLPASTTDTDLKTDEATGWWITKGNPISSNTSDQSSLDTAIFYADIQAPNDAIFIDSNPSVLFLNDSLSNGIAYDCSNMDASATYYATPFVTSYRTTIPDTSCVVENGAVGNIFVAGRPGKFTFIHPTTIDCRPDSLFDLPVYSLEVIISGYTGPVGDLGILIQDNNYSGSTVMYAPYLSGNGTYTFSQNDLTYYTPNDPGDPNWTTGLTVLSWHQTGNGMQNGNIELSLNITYPGDPGIPFPTMTYSSCIFGEPIPFSCSGCAAPLDIPTTAGIYQATNECTDASGWTHYWNNVDGTSGNSDDQLLLSIQKGTNDIGTIGDGSFELSVEVGNNNAGAAIHIPESVPYVTNPDGWYVMDRHWMVSPTTQPSSPVAVRFYYTTDDFNDIDDAPDVDPIGHESLTFYKTIGSVDPDPGTGHSGINASQMSFFDTEGIDWFYTGNAINNYHTAELVSVTGFSGGGGGASNCEGCGPLPVDLISFTGKMREEHVHLEWKTATEENNDYFTLERSEDGIRFEFLASISAKELSSQVQQYFYIDERPVEGSNYYRLSQTDIDGSSRFVGNIVVVDYKKEGFVNLYPNPATTELNIQSKISTTAFLNYELYDTVGRLVDQGTLGKFDSETIFKLDIAALSEGLYLIQIKDRVNSQAISFLKR